MPRTLEEARQIISELSDEDRLVLAEEIVAGMPSDPEWTAAWAAEAERRYQRLKSGEDPGLTVEEFFNDDD